MGTKTPDEHLYEFASSHDAIFAISDARDAGLTKAEIQHRREALWVPLYRGVFAMPGAPLTWRSELRAACAAGGPVAAVSHRAAAAFLDVPGARHIPELTCPRWLRADRPGLLVHESTRIVPGDVQVIDNLPVMRPERVLLELAGIYRSPDFIERVIHAMRRRRMITYESAIATFDRLARRGVKGVSVLRIALERWDPSKRATESEMETLLFQMLRDNGFSECIPQYEIFDAVGRFVARVDLAMPRWKVAVEYDSKQEHSDELSIARDNTRTLRIAAQGWKVLSARHHDLKTGGRELLAALRANTRAELA